ncbi:MAG: NAD-dependent epimerase/dehydratase family protein [Alphaproteobacteria bacterium]|nr:NAD-dependent epimerase/dehydratase family protein [Alphaproteobacteria bacterium]
MSTAADRDARRCAVVTGANGYLGTTLLRRLAVKGWEAHALVRAAGASAWRGEVPPAERIHAIGTDSRAIGPLVSRLRPTAILHVAAAGRISHEPEDLPSLIDANIALGAALAEAAATTDTPMVIAGSYWEFGDGGKGVANSLYAATKSALDPILAYYAAMRGLRRTKLVLTDIYGPADWRNRLLSLLVAAARDGTSLDLTDGRQEMEPIHVEDAADAFIHAAELFIRGEDIPAVVSVNGGIRLSLRDLAARVERVSGKRIAARWGTRPYPEGQIFTPVRLPPLPSWQPRHDLDSGIASLLAEAR